MITSFDVPAVGPFVRVVCERHAAAGGDLCSRDVDGCCRHCGVILDGADCDTCGGHGYHRAGCKDAEQ